MQKLAFTTHHKREILDITSEIEEAARSAAADRAAVVQLNVLHTTAALSTADLDPGGTEQDYLDAFEKIVPKLDYRHPHNPEHMPDHILSTLIGTSLSVPWDGQRLALGTWQKIVLLELDGPREREVALIVVAT